MDINNFVINRVRRATMFSTDNGEALWNITQIEDPQLSVTTDKVEAVDALGARIMEFERGKNAEFTATNTLFDFALASAQSGTEKKVAASGAGNTIAMPKWEEVELTAAQVSAKAITLTSTPVAGSLPAIYVLNGDGTLATKYTASDSAASATKFYVNGTTLNLPVADSASVLPAGTRLWIPYEFAAEDGVEVYNTAVDFPKAGKFVMEVLGNDVCNPSKEYYAYVVFPNAKLASDFDLNFTTDGKHPFTIQAMQQYCDHVKKLFSIYIPETAEQA